MMHTFESPNGPLAVGDRVRHTSGLTIGRYALGLGTVQQVRPSGSVSVLYETGVDGGVVMSSRPESLTRVDA